MSNKIKLAVYDNHTLGYIFPERPKSFHVLHASVLKGAVGTTMGSSLYIGTNTKIELAGQKEFDDFRVCFNGYKNSPQEYEFKKD